MLNTTHVTEFDHMGFFSAYLVRYIGLQGAAHGPYFTHGAQRFTGSRAHVLCKKSEPSQA